MRKILGTILAAAAISGAGTATVLGAPMDGVSLNGGIDAFSPVEDARVFCYNRYSGRFLHWGSCGGGNYMRVYCKNRYSGRFIHWGHC